MATVSKKLLPQFLMPAIFLAMIILVLVFGSCNEKPGNDRGVFVPVPTDTSSLGQIDHFITRADIDAFKSGFVRQRDSLARLVPNLFIPISETFNKQALLNLLVDSTNVGIRIYYGLKPGGNRNEVRLVLVGVNAQGQDIYINSAEGGKLGAKLPPPPAEGAVEYGQCTPPCFQTDGR